MADPKDLPGILAPPPLLTLGAILAGCGADRVLPLPLLPVDLVAPRVGLAVAVLLLAFVLFLAAVRELHRHATTPNPYAPSTAVVSSGIYRFTRNPIYIGFLSIALGVAFAVNSWWLVLLLPVLFAILHFGVVVREERYLAAKFGATYEEYRARVRRWL